MCDYGATELLLCYVCYCWMVVGLHCVIIALLVCRCVIVVVLCCCVLCYLVCASVLWCHCVSVLRMLFYDSRVGGSIVLDMYYGMWLIDLLCVRVSVFVLCV